MPSESFPRKEKRIRIRFPFCRRCVIMHGYRVQCASARCFGRIHPHQIIQYPGIAKLVSRLVWECRGGIRGGARQTAANPCNTGDSGFFSGCRKRHKSGFDHINDHRQKIFDFPPRLGIMTEIEYPGIAKLVSRLVWDQETVRSSRTTRTKNPLKSLISEGFSYSLSIASQILRFSFSTYLFDKHRLNIVIFAESQYN